MNQSRREWPYIEGQPVVKETVEDRPKEFWNKNRIPSGWEKMPAEVQKVAIETANKVYFESGNEEEALKAGHEAAVVFAEEKNLPIAYS